MLMGREVSKLADHEQGHNDYRDESSLEDS
jgi:hypothetical protein